MIGSQLVERLRASATRAGAVAAIVANVVLCEVGARVGLPGVDSSRVRDSINGMPHGLIALYNLAVGGGISRAALLAVGVVPYFQARLYLWLARGAFPGLRRATAEPATQRSVVRVATACLAVVQAFGFARFLESIPGAVATPGVAFVGRSVLMLTAGAVTVGWLAELTVGPRDTNDPQDAPHEHTLATDAPPPAHQIVAGVGAELRGIPILPLSESRIAIEVPRQREMQ